MNAAILPTEIVEDVHDGHRRLQIQIDEKRTVFAVEHPYSEWTGQIPFWLVWHEPWVGPGCLCVTDEETARVALQLLAAVAS